MKLLIIHASAGGGHRRAAEALAAAATGKGLTVGVRDMLDFTPALYRKTYADGYLKLVRMAPELWGYLYARSDRHAHRPVERRIRTLFNKLQAQSFHRFLASEKPDAVICTHFLPLEFIATMAPSRRRGLKLFGVVTDFAAHALWYACGVDAYYVASEAAGRSLQRRGQPADSIVLSGIPVSPAFASSENQLAARRRLGYSPDMPVVLLLNGGYGVGQALDLLRAFVANPVGCRLLVVAGRDPKLEVRARAIAEESALPINVFGFANNIHELMDAADLVISKPGGLTASEALAKGKPLVISEPIPGQEQRNADYLLEAGCALRLTEPAVAPAVIRALLDNPARLATLSENARHHGRPNAAQTILTDLIRRCEISIPSFEASHGLCCCGPNYPEAAIHQDIHIA